jgi:hypothetical protein
VRPDPADPNRRVQLTTKWGASARLRLRAQTPGAMTVTVNGVEVARGQWWDYGQMLVDSGPDLDWPPGRKPAPGATVTVTVTPQRMTGDWAAALQVGP